MKHELDKQLCEKYPLIFRGEGRRISCGDGWYQLLDTMLFRIQSHIEWYDSRNKWNEKWNAKVNDPSIEWDLVVPRQLRSIEPPIEQVIALQVKEKFGGLRFYYSGGDAYISGVVQLAEDMSYNICEVCGNPGTQTSSGWIRTLCSEHMQ
jgi:hypothetical protein